MKNLLDPRTKLIIAFFFTILVVASRKISWLLPEWGALVAFVIIIGKGGAYLRWLRLSLPMAVFFGAVTWWTADLKTGLMAALALLTLISIFFVFFSTTTPEDMGNSLVKIGLPYPVAFVFSTSLQFVPMIGRKAKNVLDAQRSRGIPLEPGWSALRHYPAFLGPLLIQAFQLAEELAAAMETRGFGRPGRTFYKDYRMGSADWLTIAVSLLLLTACLIWQQG
ncbi:MAG: energy-coupling factor transporter transmembrane component T [Desulfobacterales bacterium]|nr:energy-coupling factor transporter transmembrane component T [Desulfobacterales bacterium]